MDNKEYYKILGITTTATKKEIKLAYRKLVSKYHPDKNKSDDATEMIKKINEAHDTLSDDEKRKQYDNASPSGFTKEAWDMWENFFFNNRTEIKNSDLFVTFNINVDDLFHNFAKNIQYTINKICLSCGGKGVNPNVCAACDGFGFQTSIENLGIDNIDQMILSPKIFFNKGHLDRSLSSQPGHLYVQARVFVPEGEINNNLDTVIMRGVDCLSFAIGQEIEIEGLNKEKHMIKLNSEKREYLIQNKGIPGPNHTRHNLIFKLYPKVNEIKDLQLKEQIKAYLNT